MKAIYDHGKGLYIVGEEVNFPFGTLEQSRWTAKNGSGPCTRAKLHCRSEFR
jgi:hypothetical protein